MNWKATLTLLILTPSNLGTASCWFGFDKPVKEIDSVRETIFLIHHTRFAPEMQGRPQPETLSELLALKELEEELPKRWRQRLAQREIAATTGYISVDQKPDVWVAEQRKELRQLVHNGRFQDSLPLIHQLSHVLKPLEMAWVVRDFATYLETLVAVGETQDLQVQYREALFRLLESLNAYMVFLTPHVGEGPTSVAVDDIEDANSAIATILYMQVDFYLTEILHWLPQALRALDLASPHPNKARMEAKLFELSQEPRITEIRGLVEVANRYRREEK